MPSKLKKAIGAVKDQTSISLAKVASNVSSNLEVAVLKATTHDDVGMEERYVREILQLVSSNKVHAASCARAIGKRIGRTRNWIVAIKSLMLVLRIFQDGDPYFPREVLHAMKRGAKILNLSSFRDDSNSSPWDFTAYVRTFALYLDERLDCFLTGKLQRRYTSNQEREPFHRRSWQDNEPMRDMKPAMLLDKISYWQRLLDRAVATRPTGAAKGNRLVQISLYAVVQESFDLYKDISDGLALLLDSFFHLQYNSCVSAFQACVKATKQFEELGAFYDLCKSIGVGRTSEYPSVQKISEELIETLQEFLKDQSSFPLTNRSPSRPQLPLPAPSNACSTYTSDRRHDSLTQSEFSETTCTTERASEFGSRCTSLEDLISATELTGASPSISIDLEAYSIMDQFESANDNDDGSTRSLPVTNSMIDLVSLDEWPQEQDQQYAQEREQGEVSPEPSSSPPTGWELVLAEIATATPKPTNQPLFNNGFGPFLNQDDQEQKPEESSSREGWELMLVETATTNPSTASFSFSSIDNLYPQTTNPLPQDQYYNPFLQDMPELTTILTVGALEAHAATAGGSEVNCFADDEFSSWAPTFHATTAPTFSAQNPHSTSIGFQEENDPFGPYSNGGSEEGFGGSSRNQQDLLQEQQLWLQHQNKIIARHMA